ncbi:CRISPR-associated endoribonuclease Cas6 [Anabaena sp. AL93]|jgi:CRISPR-associated endoribonuclease Cas6|uniref:CRISPR-associated endoribonuclease Cas6 n=1 Tax=Anabaena sp. AL93 TaxID=1678133 RepID=UPI0007FFF5EF|nr:CRISPR-associated endoribonuclease Cas6 [Anabaena sp. AL93]OBQ22641.1 MAG: CRISPR-associated protein Cas5 [Anabaena sp. AL93]
MAQVQLYLAKIMTLQSLVIQLGAASESTIPTTLGRAIHAQVMQWLSLGDAQIATAVHDSQESPLSLSGLIGYRRKQGIQLGDDFVVRISLLDSNLIQPLLQGIESSHNKSIYLGKCPFVIRSIYSLPGTHPLVDSSDYTILANTSVSSDITLQFLSPTSFKQNQNIQPFPLPDLVFNSLLRRWNRFAPAELQFPQVEWQGLVSAFELKTHALKMEAGAEIGTVGWIKYRFPNPEEARIATILANFAVFSGVGRKTAMGMGQVKIKN